jgi:hypothetical protein
MNSTARSTSSPRLRVVPKEPRTRRELGVVGQVRAALKPRNRLATTLGALLGGGVPMASWQLAHHEVDATLPIYAQLPAWLVVGGLLFSALTVCQWAREAFGSPWKALGFTVLLEGILTFAHTPWLSVASVCYLVAINATATGVRLSRSS